MTAFETNLLHTLTDEILSGQLSYKQKSEIYNYSHGYDSVSKRGPISSLQCVHEEERRYVHHIHVHEISVNETRQIKATMPENNFFSREKKGAASGGI